MIMSYAQVHSFVVYSITMGDNRQEQKPLTGNKIMSALMFFICCIQGPIILLLFIWRWFPVSNPINIWYICEILLFSNVFFDILSLTSGPYGWFYYSFTSFVWIIIGFGLTIHKNGVWHLLFNVIYRLCRDAIKLCYKIKPYGISSSSTT